MEISIERLRTLLGEAFDTGYQNSAELKDQLLDEILLRWQSQKEEQYRVFKVEELRQMPVGAVFHHTTRGRGWIISKADGSKHMQFEKGQVVGFSQNADPWDRPMRLLHADNK